MKTGKIIFDPSHPYQNREDDKFHIPVTFYKNAENTGGKVHPKDKDSMRLEVLSLLNYTYFGAIHYDIHLHMKLDYTISRIFQEMSLSELEKLHH